jgi:hippurate hydrolase
MKRRAPAALATIFLTSLSCAAAELDAAGARAQIDAALDSAYSQLEALYRDVHQHPELGFRETRTAARLAKEMRSLGFTVTEKVGGTGIVAIYRNGAGPTVMVRTELDALPMEEKTGLPFASREQTTWEGGSTLVMHACGHDSHMAMWVGAARSLIAMKDDWQGTLMFIGQPAEETLRGAKAMLDDGLFERFPKPDFAFAAHVAPLAAGTFATREGVATSSSDTVEITFKGRGGHGSKPSATIDPVVIAARFVTDVQTIISREKDAARFGVVTVGSFQSGSVANIIPDEANLKLTLRSYEPDVRSLLVSGVTRVANASAAMAGAPAPLITLGQGSASVVNDAALTQSAMRVLREAFGDKATVSPGPSSASEDFSQFITAGVPATLFTIGGVDPVLLSQAEAEGKQVPANHSPHFAPVPEPTIKTGAAVLALATLSVLARQ